MAITDTAGTELYWDPYAPELVADPYATYRRLREEEPLYYNERYDFYAVSRFDDCRDGLRDARSYISGKGGILEVIKADMEMPSGILIFEDPPVHTVHRRLLSRVFTPGRIAGLEPKIREFCARCLDPLIGSDGFDLIRELGAQMPMRVIGMLMGIPESGLEAVRDQVDANLRTRPGQPMEARTEGFSDGMIAEYIDWRADHPSDDVMTALLHTEFEDETGTVRTLTRDEAVIYATVVAGAGNETTNRLIGWAGKVLGQHPDQRRQVASEPSLVPNTVEELLRYEPPGPAVARFLPQDVELHGQRVPAGSAMVFLVAAANRDDRQFDDPERFDIHRQIGQHLTFGYGIHFCLGAALARLEGRVALEELLARFPDWEVDMDNAPLATTSTVRGWETLPIVLG
jgi:cytochrome P450